MKEKEAASETKRHAERRQKLLAFRSDVCRFRMMCSSVFSYFALSLPCRELQTAYQEKRASRMLERLRERDEELEAELVGAKSELAKARYGRCSRVRLTVVRFERVYLILHVSHHSSHRMEYVSHAQRAHLHDAEFQKRAAILAWQRRRMELTPERLRFLQNEGHAMPSSAVVASMQRRQDPQSFLPELHASQAPTAWGNDSPPQEAVMDVDVDSGLETAMQVNPRTLVQGETPPRESETMSVDLPSSPTPQAAVARSMVDEHQSAMTALEMLDSPRTPAQDLDAATPSPRFVKHSGRDASVLLTGGVAVVQEAGDQVNRVPWPVVVEKVMGASLIEQYRQV